MNPRETGFLLLTSMLGREDRRPLTSAQLRVLAERVAYSERTTEDRDLQVQDLVSLGYRRELAEHILTLLSEENLLREYLHTGEKLGCVPITRVSENYPRKLRSRLGTGSTGCLWAKGNLELLERPGIALVGSREVNPKNAAFAAEVGYQAARQGFVLISGNARGADRIAQDSCLRTGGCVISVVSDPLYRQQPKENMLFLSEGGYADAFSAPRALSRNRVIHALAEAVFVAQCTDGHGGTWDGTVKNLRFQWSPVFCYADGSSGTSRLRDMGATAVLPADLQNIRALFQNESQMTFGEEP